jgi:hypothetical protein
MKQQFYTHFNAVNYLTQLHAFYANLRHTTESQGENLRQQFQRVEGGFILLSMILKRKMPRKNTNRKISEAKI